MIYLIRHASTWNSQHIIQGTNNDIEISATGRNQAAAVAEKMKRFNVEKIVSSEIKRAKQTAKKLGEVLNKSIEDDARLNEYDYGLLTGLDNRTLDLDSLTMFLKNPVKFNAEPWADAFARVGSFLNEQDYSKNTLVVTHSSILYIMMSYLENKNTFDIYSCWKKRQKYKIANCDVLRISAPESEMKMLRNVYFCKLKEQTKS